MVPVHPVVSRTKHNELQHLVAMKSKSDEKAERLAQEIANMKAAKVALIKRMREDGAKMR